ncbi:hypothetical protein KTE19_11625 [Lentilactobacillus sp. IMAU92037]|nr:hypothetical protein [Lentilactobacillus dabitei]MBU9788206.1 hypothetical protein [Lentilactobacillus dabitei]MBV0931336.1 hypothetical protein [Lentilactobacillus dabitei]
MQLSKNDQVILMSAQADYADQRFNQVMHKVEHLLAKYPNQIDVNFLRTKALFKLKRTAEAQSIINRYEDEFVRVAEWIPSLIEISLKNAHFMVAREIAAQSVADWRTQILAAEENYRQQHAELLDQQINQFAHIGGLNAYTQVRRVEDAKQLPFDEYVLAGKNILRDPFLWEVPKSQILLELVKVNADVSVTLNWLDNQDYEINILKLKSIDQYSSLVAVLNIIEDNYASSDPIKLALLEKELFTQSNYIYPFFDKVITDPEYWFQAIVARSFGDQIDVNTSDQRLIMKWISIIYDQESKIKLM